MSSIPYRRSIAYGLSLASTGIALFLSLWLQPFLEGAIGSFFYIAVIVSTWYGGIRPGIVTTALSFLAINYYFTLPVHQFSIGTSGDVARLGIFLLVSFVINALNSDLRRSQHKVTQLSQQLLAESSDRLRMALTAAQMGMWDWNLVTGEIVWSPEHEQLFGLAPGTFDGRYETFAACLHPTDRDGLTQAVQVALENHTVYQHEFRVIWADNSVHWIEGRGQASYDHAGQPVRMSGTVMNIDHRKQAEIAWIQSEQRFRSLVEQSPLATMRFAADGSLLSVNPAWEEMWRSPVAALAGYNILQDHQIEAIGDLPATQRAFAGEVIDLPARFYNPAMMGHSGCARWVEPFLYPIKDHTGQLLEVVLVTKDVTDRKQAEIALMRNEQHLRAILDAEPECVKVITVDGILRSINPAGLAIVEADSTEQALGQCIFPLVDPAYRQEFLEFTQAAANGKAGILEFEGIGLKGTRRWLESHAVPLNLPEATTPHVLAVTRDVTDRKRAEAALRQSEERLRQILQDMPVMLDAFDENWNVIVWNQECERVTGFSAAEVIQNSTIMEQFYPNVAYREQMMAAWAAQGNNYRNWEWDVTCKDGSTRTVCWSNISDQFAVAGWATWGIGVDVTDRKRAEAELKQLNAELEQRVAERTAALSEANDRLQTELFRRERMERALQESKLKFHAVFDQSRLFIGLLQPDGTVFEVNQRPAELTAIVGERFVGRLFWELAIWGQKQQSQMKAVIDRALAGEVVRLEINLHAQDGSLLQMPDGGFVTHDIRVKAVKNAAGQVMFLTVEGWDISDLKQTQAALQASEERLQFALEASRDGLWDWNIETGEVYHSPQYLELLGYDMRGGGELSINAQQWEQLIHPEDKPWVLEHLKAHLEDAAVQYAIDYRVRTQAGAWKWISDHGKVVVRDQQKPLRMTGTYRDITDRKRAEAALQASEAKFRTLTESSPIGVFMTDAKGQNIYTNPRAQEIGGYSSAEALGSGWSRFVHPDDLQILLDDWTDKAVEQQISVYDGVRYLNPDGTVRRYARVQIVPLSDADGTLTAYMGTIEDITERLAIDQMKAEFISVVSHELRTPLTSMQAALSLLVEKIIAPASEEGETIIQIASEGVDRLVRLVNDILDLERLEFGKIRLEKRLCNTADLIATAIDQMQGMATQAGVALDVSSSSFEINADPDRLLQVLINLLSNAIKFSSSGSTVELSVALQPHSAALLFTVKDQGRGIPTDKLESIFERFQQVDASDSREKGGTGLGLAICRNIVQQHKGNIWVESVLEQGSTFYFTIPIVEALSNGNKASVDN
jgi:PAS domain S-box-containing protein